MDFNSIDPDLLATVVDLLKERDVEEAIVGGVHIKFRAPEVEVETKSTPTVTREPVKPKNPYEEVLGQAPPTWLSTQKQA